MQNTRNKDFWLPIHKFGNSLYAGVLYDKITDLLVSFCSETTILIANMNVPFGRTTACRQKLAGCGRGNMFVVKWLLCVIAIVTRPVESTIRTMRGSKGSYCNAPVLPGVALPGNSAVLCAAACSRNAQCVAYSVTHNDCLLHDNFCSAQDLQADPAALYAGRNDRMINIFLGHNVGIDKATLVR